jgi:hypothetical protein
VKYFTRFGAFGLGIVDVSPTQRTELLPLECTIRMHLLVFFPISVLHEMGMALLCLTALVGYQIPAPAYDSDLAKEVA